MSTLTTTWVRCGGGLTRLSERFAELPSSSWALDTTATRSPREQPLIEDLEPVMVMLGGQAENRTAWNRVTALPLRSHRWTSVSWTAIPSTAAGGVTPTSRFGHAAGLIRYLVLSFTKLCLCVFFKFNQKN